MRNADEQNRRYFAEAYETGRHGWQVTGASPQVAAHLARLAREQPGARVLDLGCGEGRHCLLAAQLGLVPVGVDYEPGAIRRARAFTLGAATSARFLVADALALPFRPGSFDALLDYGCLHHQRKADWPRYLASLCAVLRPGGHVILSVFSTAFRVYGPQERPWHLAHGAYRRFFTEDDLHALFDGEFEFLSLEEERTDVSGFWHVLMRRT